MWKDFFYYSKSERRAVYVLSVLIVVFAVGSLVLPYYVKTEQPSVLEQEERDSFVVRVYEQKRRYSADVRPQKVNVVLNEFDPNLADSIELLNLGLSSFVVHNIMKYRAKGGTFKTPESFSRIYGLSTDLFTMLKPYISISDSYMSKPVVAQNSHTFVERKDTIARSIKYPEGTLVDIGVADTTELKKIPGIGSGIAKAIVGYRERLGGFFSLKQLSELDYVTPEMMKWFVLNESPIRKININKAGLDKLRAHPYLNFYQAKVIVEHRKKRGQIKSLSQLSLYEEFTEKDLERIAVYFSFD